MDIVERITVGVRKGLESSKDLLDKAKEQAKNLGDTGVEKYELKCLQDEKSKLFRELGEAVFTIFTSGEQQTITKRTAGVKELFQQIETTVDKLKAKEENFSEPAESEEASI